MACYSVLAFRPTTEVAEGVFIDHHMMLKL